MPSPRFSRRFASPAVVSWVAACGIGCGALDGGQTGDGSPATPPTEDHAGGSQQPASAPDDASGCREERRVVAEPSEVGELGFSAEQAASVFERQERQRLVWNQDLASAPAVEPELSEVVLTWRAGGKAASWVSPAPSDEAVADCEPYLELPVVVEVQSSGGALDERAAGSLAVRSLAQASLEQAFEVEELAGAWRASLEEANVTRVELRVDFTEEGSRGRLLVRAPITPQGEPSAQSPAASSVAAEWAPAP